jgi:hypothetical protein
MFPECSLNVIWDEQVDEDGSREINFAVFLKIIERHKAMQGYVDQTEVDTLEAFAALGGGPDGSGSVSLDKVAALIKVTLIMVI